MRCISYSNRNKYYLVDTRNPLIFFNINPLIAKKIKLYEVGLDDVYPFLKETKKLNSLSYNLIIINSVVLGGIINKIESPKIIDLSNQTILIIIIILFIIKFIVRYLECLSYEKKIININDHVVNGKLYFNKRYIPSMIAVRIMILGTYFMIIHFLSKGEVLMLFLACFMLAMNYWLNTVLWNVNCVRLDDGTILEVLNK